MKSKPYRSDPFVAKRCVWCGIYGLPEEFDYRGMCVACQHKNGEPPDGECRACGQWVSGLFDGYCSDCWTAIEEADW